MDRPESLVLFDPMLEHADADEAQTTADIDATMARIREKTFGDGGHAIRSVHAKSTGLLRGRLTVDADLPEELAQGLFAEAGSYPVAMRLSTVPGDLVADSISTPRGMAVKVIGVAGERLAGSEGDATQDFVLVDAPAFNAATTKKFLGNLKALAATTDKAEGAKKALAATLRVVEKAVEAFGGQSATLVSLGGHAQTNPLGETYYSQAAIRYGRFVAKVSVAPASDSLLALKDAEVDLADRPDGLRDAVVAFFAREGGTWDVRVQLCTDLETMPIEDASVEWPQDKSPYRRVARIVVEPQTAWSAALSRAVDDGLLFSPWHGLAAHRPLGQVMRARRLTYAHSARFRAEQNGVPVVEPRDLDFWPG